MEENSAPDEEPEHLPAKLEPWARITSIVLGGALAFTGGWAVLADSGNQAGTLGVFLMGLVLLVMGLQNTPLTGITAGGGASFAIQRKIQQVKELANEKRDEGEPDEAKAVIDTAKVLNPEIFRDPAIRALDYEVRVGIALNALLSQGIRSLALSGTQVDYAIQTPGGRSIAVEVKYLSSRLSRSALNHLVRRIQSALLPGGEHFAGLLIVTNGSVNSFAGGAEVEGFPVEFVTWNGGIDVTELRQGLDRLRARLKAD
jgi:hypothetical protein